MRIFINAKTQAMCESIAAALEELSCECVLCFTDEEAAADLSEFDAVIVSTPLRSEFGLNYIADVRGRIKGCIIVLAKTDIAEDVQSRIRFTGAFVLPRPFTKSALVQTVRLSLLAKENIRRLEDENDRLSRKLDDNKLLSRAKCCLIQYLNLTEEQAHRHIHKLAMDSRRSVREVSEDILQTYSGAAGI